MTTPLALVDALRVWTDRLAAAGVEQPALDARLLAADALGRDAKGLVLFGPSALSAAQAAQIDDRVARRAAGEPTARILGRREFWSLSFALTPATLDPRPDSETLVDCVLAALPDRAAPLTLADLGTGSGCLLLALLSELPAAQGIGVDRAPEAAVAARANATTLGLSHRARFLVGDWCAALADRSLDALVSNPPYIPSGDIAGLAREVRAWDPLLALDGGADGLDCYRALAAAAGRVLRPGGLLAFEIGWDQADAVAALLAPVVGDTARVARDLAGHDRVVWGWRRS